MHYVFTQIFPVKLAIISVIKDFWENKGADFLSILNQLTVDVLKLTNYSCKESFIDGFMTLEGPKHMYLNIGTFDYPELYPPDIELPYELFPGQEK